MIPYGSPAHVVLVAIAWTVVLVVLPLVVEWIGGDPPD